MPRSTLPAIGLPWLSRLYLDTPFPDDHFTTPYIAYHSTTSLYQELVRFRKSPFWPLLGVIWSPTGDQNANPSEPDFLAIIDTYENAKTQLSKLAKLIEDQDNAQDSTIGSDAPDANDDQDEEADTDEEEEDADEDNDP